MTISLTNFLSDISLVPSWDLLIFIIFVAAIFLYGLTAGKNRLIVLLLSTYFSFVIVVLIPWGTVSNLINAEELPSPTAKIFLFLAIAVAISFLIPHSVLGSSFKTSRHGRGAWIQVLLFAICEIGLLTSIILSFLPNKVLTDINPLIKQIFSGSELQFFWALIPILTLILLRPKKGELG